jgi:transposase
MEATMFTGWIYDHLKPHAATLKVAHPLMLRAVAAAKKKNDRIDAGKICDCLRCDFLPERYIASTAIREQRRTLRYRKLSGRSLRWGYFTMNLSITWTRRDDDGWSTDQWLSR